MNIYILAIQHISLAVTTVAMVVLGAPASAQAQSVSVTTHPASFVSETNAKLGGHVSNPWNNSTVWFLVGTDRDSIETSGWATRKKSIYNEASFDIYISGLVPGTTYFYKAVAAANNSAEPSYGEIMSFVARKNSPTNNTTATTTGNASESGTSATNANSAITEAPGIITPTSAQLKGLSLPEAGTNTQAWFEWGTTSSLGKSTAKKQVGGTSASFDQMINELPSSTTHYYRAVIQNEKGVFQGAIMSFTTRADTTAGAVKNTTEQKTGTASKKDAETTRDNRSPFGASVYGSGFFPETATGWMVLVAILFAIVFTLNRMHDESVRRADEKKKREKEAKEKNVLAFPVRT